jgi:molecular chaperone DnaK
MRIMPDSGLSEAEIQRMVDEAEQHKEEDNQRKAGIEKRNSAENLAHAAQKMLDEHGEQIEESLKADLETKIAAVRTALDGGDSDTISSASDDLNQTLQQVGTQMHQQAAAADQPASAPGPDADSTDDTDEDVIEGQFEEA